MNKGSNRTLAISKLTDIYLKKKPELIEICILNKLKSVGTVYEIRIRLSNFYKGNSTFNDLEDTLDEREKRDIINISIENKIRDTDLEAELNETITNNQELSKEIAESKKVYENLNNKAQDISKKIETIISGCENYYQNKLNDENEYELINLNNQESKAGPSKIFFTGDLSNIIVTNNTTEQLHKSEVKEFVEDSNNLIYDNALISSNNHYSNNLEPTVNKQREEKIHFYDEVDYNIINKNLNVELGNKIGLVNEKKNNRFK